MEQNEVIIRNNKNIITIDSFGNGILIKLSNNRVAKNEFATSRHELQSKANSLDVMWATMKLIVIVKVTK